MKYIVVTGGVLSGLGKGILASSIGLLLKSCGLTVTAVKIDPYLNCDAGTMNPYQHGEVYVMDDGGEVDLDLGNYERFLDIVMGRDNNITTGKAYLNVIQKERKGDYLGQTVQIIPHVTNEIREMIIKVGEESGADAMIIELGGTVGDIESMPFVEALRQMRSAMKREDIIFVHTTLVPVMGVVGEQKTKPTQHSVKTLMSLGIHPDMIGARCSNPLAEDTRRKISLFCDVPDKAVLSVHDVENIHEVPLLLEEQGVTDYLREFLALDITEPNLDKWAKYVDILKNAERTVRIALIGKYTHLKDSYISHMKALNHAGVENNVKLDFHWVESTDLERTKDTSVLDGCDGILVPGGFGYRGAEGKMLAIQYARENGIPYLGVCFGMQLAVIEFARNVVGWDDANSGEFVDEFGIESDHRVIDLMPEQKELDEMGATMRLGAQDVFLKEGTMVHGLYGTVEISERHRHRYEVNPEFIPIIEENGMVFSGNDGGIRMECAEIPDHPFFLATQFHPEFKSRPGRAAPPFRGFVKAAKERSR